METAYGDASGAYHRWWYRNIDLVLGGSRASSASDPLRPMPFGDAAPDRKRVFEEEGRSGGQWKRARKGGPAGCSYCGATNHHVSSCWKKQRDEAAKGSKKGDKGGKADGKGKGGKDPKGGAWPSVGSKKRSRKGNKPE